jgi:hypothetical protein
MDYRLTKLKFIVKLVEQIDAEVYERREFVPRRGKNNSKNSQL